MLVSRDWLADYVDLDMTEEQLTHRLTMSGLNHEGSVSVGNDQCIDLEVTSNRADCLGHVGVAREISVLFEKPLTIPDPQPVSVKPAIGDEFSVSIQCPDLCYRFTARLIRGVKLGPSPQWLHNRLTTAGIGTVNNIVDISNYVMLECGQPLHTFDYDKLQGGQIIVREPTAGEELVAIDHRTYPLEPGMCVIADGRRAVGLGGVMGGAETEVSESTKNVLVEAAFFNPLAIRNTARRLNLHSPASFRFERAIDSQQIEWASRRCCQLIMELAGGQLAEGFIDSGAAPTAAPAIALRFAQVDRILGIRVPRRRIPQIVESLGFLIQQQDEDSLVAAPPSWRNDVTREVDLIEEVGRIYGYDQVPDDVKVPMSASVRSHEERTTSKIRLSLTAAGFDEAMTASLVPQVWSDAFSPWHDGPPLASSQPMLGVLEKASQNIGQVNLLRRSLVPSLLEVFRINEYKQNEDVDLFEIAKVYLSQPAGLPQEPWKLALVSQRDFVHVKGVIEALLARLNPDYQLDALPCDEAILHITWSAELRLGQVPLGWLGQVSRHGKEIFGFRRDATVAELDLGLLLAEATQIAQFQEISQFPSVIRDFNFVVADSVRWHDLAGTVRQSAGQLAETVTYKETFRDPAKDGAGKKRMLLSVVFRSLHETLTGEQVEHVCQRIIRDCGTAHDAHLLQ